MQGRYADWKFVVIFSSCRVARANVTIVRRSGWPYLTFSALENPTDRNMRLMNPLSPTKLRHSFIIGDDLLAASPTTCKFG